LFKFYFGPNPSVPHIHFGFVYTRDSNLSHFVTKMHLESSVNRNNNISI